MSTLSPIAPSRRLELVDALRGFAIFGILMVNLHAMFIPAVEYLMMPDFSNGIANEISDYIVTVLFAGKYMTLFSLLFGFGFFNFLYKGGELSPGKVRTFLKRIFWLLVIGILHVTFLWPGDILFFYALFGFILILFRKSSIRKISIWMLVFFLLPIVFVGILSAMPTLLSSNPEALNAMEESNRQQAAQTTALIQSAYEIYSSGSYTQIISMNWQNWSALLPGSLIVYCLGMAMFLLGLIFARKQLFHNYRDHLPLFRKILWIALPIAIPLNLALPFIAKQTEPFVMNGWFFLVALFMTVGGVALMLSNVSAFILLYANGKINKLASMLAPVGRMALTNYLMHSLIALFIAAPFGLGLYGKVQLWQSLLLTVAIFVFQIFFSRWWLSKFSFGPAEWLWRSLTYGKIQGFKRQLTITPLEA
ncbi:MAG: DUF418 domain-containing protein [Bacteroidales bacterium]